MCNRMIDYLEKNNILYQHQYGFRKGHSTDLAIVTVTDFILQALENRDCVLAIYMDLSKAFDVINHDILLKKLCLWIVPPKYKEIHQPLRLI